MKILREKGTGKLIPGDMVGRSYWISKYYLCGDIEINIPPVKVKIDDISCHNIKLSCVSPSDIMTERIDIMRRTLGPGSIEFFDTYEDSVDYYNECISNEVEYMEDKINEITEFRISDE